MRTSPGTVADRLGVCLSLACAVHCAAAPLILAALAASGVELAIGDFWHSAFLLGTCALAAGSLCCSYRKHRKKKLWLLYGAGVVVLAAGHAAGEGPHEAYLTAAGGLLLASCHLLNRRFCREGCSTDCAPR